MKLKDLCNEQEKALKENRDEELDSILTKYGLNAENLGIKYYASSFDYNFEPSDEEESGDESTGTARNIHNSLYMPSHIEIDDESFVEVVKNKEVVFAGEWIDVQEWLENNFSEMNGKYFLQDQKGNIIHTFKIS